MNSLHPTHPKDRDPNLVFIGMPSVRGGLYDLVRAIVTLELDQGALAKAGSNLRFMFYHAKGQGIAKARNLLTYVARCTPASRVVMVDNDVKPTVSDFVRLAGHKADLVGALYPKKMLKELKWVGEFEAATENGVTPEGLWPMQHVGSGFISFPMTTVDRLVEQFPAQEYMNDEDDPTSGLAYGQKMHDFFGMGVVKGEWFGTEADPAPRTYARYMTEDYFFSMLVRQAGMKAWVDSQCQVGHVGEIDFLELHNEIERRIAEALVQYKQRLQSVGVKVPVLIEQPDGSVTRAAGH